MWPEKDYFGSLSLHGNDQMLETDEIYFYFLKVERNSLTMSSAAADVFRNWILSNFHKIKYMKIQKGKKSKPIIQEYNCT